MGVAGFDPAAANQGAYAGVVKGISFRPKRGQEPKPAAGGHQKLQPPQPLDAVNKAVGVIRPTLDM